MVGVDVEAAVIEIAQAALPGESFGSLMWSGAMKDLPLTVVRRVSTGSGDTDPRFADRALVDVQSWGSTRGQAYDSAWAVANALMDAWNNQTTTTSGVNLSWVGITAYPSELRDELQLDNTWRFQATYSIIARTKE